MEYPLESMPPLWGEDGSEFPAPSFVGNALGDLPLDREVGILGLWPPPSLICPICTALGGVLPTSGGMESDSLETMWGTGWSGYSVLDLWQHLSEVAVALHQPSTSGRRMMTNKQSEKSTQGMPLPCVSLWHPALVPCGPAYHKRRDMLCLSHPPVHTQDLSAWYLPSGCVGPYRHSKRMQVGAGAQVN